MELYSNAIVGFIVLQNLAFCYHFGTCSEFNCIVRTTKGLSLFLPCMFAANTLLCLYATYFIGKNLQRMNEAYSSLIRAMYFGKAIAICLFSTLLIVVMISGMHGQPKSPQLSTVGAREQVLDSQRVGP